MRIVVQGLPEATSDVEVAGLFEAHGTVRRVELARDARTGRLTGEAMVEMPTANEAEAAIKALDRSVHDGSTLTVRPGPRFDGGTRAHGEE